MVGQEPLKLLILVRFQAWQQSSLVSKDLEGSVCYYVIMIVKEATFLDFDKKGKLNKFYSWIPNLYLSPQMGDIEIKLEDDFYICSKQKHKFYRGIINDHIKNNFNVVNIRSVILFFKYPKNYKYYFLAEDKVRRFLSAVKIFYGKNSDSLLGLSISDNQREKYYKFDNYSSYSDRHREIITDVHIRRNFIEIKDKKELNQIKLIYKNLGVVDSENFHKYSPLHNSIKFFEHSYDERWTVLKTMLLFISLESILSEKTEVAYKIASRASYLLYPKDPSNRIKIFNFLRKAYTIRSSFAHGGNFEREIRKIEERMKKDKSVEYYGFHDDFIKDLENIVTGCLKRILLNRELTIIFSLENNQEKVSEYLDKLVIG